ncbi:metallophosphoesterase [Ancylomarina longa]|uniref:Calcineurin-like phosphoesterase domain-containing protein n=1 Tax=Ancylomarina longa TaxID=2487017 RepID=A0A434AF24_9BACT|nr:metallophosphoesterase [Ancylomarina longa]RUT72974.1 hypothetical protein DLK05_15720 [Ancylomarina longa]
MQSIYKRRVFLTMMVFIGLFQHLKAQKKKDNLGSGAFSSYDVIYKGNLDKVNLPDYVDGPYFFWVNSKEVKSWYIDHDQEENTISIRQKKIKVKRDSVQVKGQKGDSNRYWLHKGDYPVQPTEYSGVDKLMVVGDVHGEYDDMVELLQNNGVIDSKLNWSWGSGQLVFVGDIFDRGNKVTESLYLIKKLQRQAKQSSGRLNLLLGNHEIMILMRDSRYVSPKYKNMTNRLMINYSRFFAADTELGKWLRSLNTVVKINDMIFVHGGLSPDLVSRDLSLEQINKNIRMSLNADNAMSHKEIMRTIYFPENPLWYRGYLMKSKSYSLISSEDLDRVLKFYDAKIIFFGHTEVDSIRLLYDHRLGAINVPMGCEGIKSQLLLVQKGNFFRCFKNGEKQAIK